MASFDIFSQLQGPQIDINLFSQNATAGANVGNAVPTALTAGIKGAIKGIQTGQAIVENYQQAEIRQNQIDQIPVENEIRQEQLEAQKTANDVRALELENDKATQALQLENKKATLESQNAALARQAEDIATQKEISAAISSNDPTKQREVLTNPKYNDWMLRHPNDADFVLGKISGALTPEEQEQAWKTLNFSKAMEAENVLKKANAALIQKNAAEVDKAFDGVRGNAELNAVVGNVVDPGKLANDFKVVQNKNDTTRYDVQDKNGNIVSGPQGISATAASDYLKFKNSYDSQAKIVEQHFWPGGKPTVKETPGPAATPTPVPTLNAGPGPTATPSPLGPNATIQEKVEQRFETNRQKAVASGQTELYSRMAAKGQEFVPSPSVPSTVATSQNTPVPPSQPAITRSIDPKLDALFARQEVQQMGGQLPSKREDFILNDPNEVSNLKTKIEGVKKELQDETASLASLTDKDNAGKYPEYTGSTRDRVAKKQTELEDLEQQLSKLQPIRYLDERASALLGTASKVNFIAAPPKPEIVGKINSIPALQGYNPLIKGMVAVESAGNPFAVSEAGAGGLMQLMPGTAAEMGLSDSERFDAEKNVEAGAGYLQKQMASISKQLQRESDKTGLPIAFDIRFPLAAYNGGLKHVLAGISKGYTTWEEMKPYLASVKSPKNAKQNLEYPDKVLAATLAFMQGGNQADDDIMKQFLNHGIVELA